MKLKHYFVMLLTNNNKHCNCYKLEHNKSARAQCSLFSLIVSSIHFFAVRLTYRNKNSETEYSVTTVLIWATSVGLKFSWRSVWMPVFLALWLVFRFIPPCDDILLAIFPIQYFPTGVVLVLAANKIDFPNHCNL